MRNWMLLILWMLNGLLWQSLAHATTFTVINENASGSGSLRWAVESANTNAGPDSIDFAPSVRVINPSLANSANSGLGPLVVTGDLTIQGPGTDKLKIDGQQSWIDPSGNRNTGLPCNQSGTFIAAVSGIVFHIPTPGVNLKVEGMTITQTGGLLAAAGNRGGGVIEFSDVRAFDNAPISGLSPARSCDANLIDMGWGGELRITNSQLYLNKIGFDVVNETGLVISRSNTKISGSLFDTNSCYMASGGQGCDSTQANPGTWDLRVFRGEFTRYYGGTADTVDIRDTRFNNLVNRVGFENHDTIGNMAVSITNSAFFERSRIAVAVQESTIRQKLPAYTGVYAMNADLSLTNVSLLLPSYKYLGDGAQPLGANLIGSHLNAIGKSTVRVANSVIHTTESPSLASGERLAPLVGMTRCGLVPGCQGGIDDEPAPGNATDFPYSYVDDATLAAYRGVFIGSLIYAGVTPPPGTSIAKNKAANGTARYNGFVGCDRIEAVPGGEGICIMPKVPDTVFETNPIFNSGANALAVYPGGAPILKDLVNRNRIIDVTVDMGAVETVVTAKPESYTTTQGVTLQIPRSTGVLANDLNCGTGPLVAQLPGASGGISMPTPHGNVTLRPDGSFTYTPTPSFVGFDSFTYRIPTQNCLLGGYGVTVQLEVVPVTSAPRLSVSSEGDQAIGLVWNQPPNPPAGSITGYAICRGTGASPDPSSSTCPGTLSIVSGASTLATIINGLVDGTPYWFMVRSTTSGMPGPWSNVALGTPNGPPGAPTVSATAGNSQVSLSFPGAAPNGAPILSYLVKYRAVGSLNWQTWPFSGTDTTTTVGGLTNFTAYEFSVAAVNANGTGAEGTVIAMPFVAPTLSYATPVTGYENNSLTITPLVTNSAGNQSYSIVSGNLPTGMNLDPDTGVVSGTPDSGTNSGSPYEVSIGLTESGSVSSSVTAPLKIVVTNNPPDPTLFYPSLTGLAGNGPVNLVPSVGGFSGTPTFSIAVGEPPLPAGLVLNSNGSIGGTPTTATSGVVLTTVRAENGSEIRQAPLIIEILPTLGYPTGYGVVGNAIMLTPSTSPSAEVGEYSVVSGTLPPGLSLNPTSGVISGNPTATYFGSITIQFATGAEPRQTAQAIVPITITGYSISLTYPPGNATQYKPVTFPPTVGGYKGRIAYTLSYGSLPDGLQLDPVTGVIAGTPAGSPGTATFGVQVTDGFTSAVTQVSITVKAAQPSPPNPIPTMNDWAKLVLILLLMGTAGWFNRRSA